MESLLEAFEAKSQGKLHEIVYGFQKEFCLRLAKVNKTESLLLLGSFKTNLKLTEEVTKSLIMATLT